MNDLNSVLLEGLLESSLKLSNEDENLEFFINNTYTFLKVKLDYKSPLYDRMVETFKDRKENFKVRIVGKIIGDIKEDICVLAEHIEIKPR